MAVECHTPIFLSNNTNYNSRIKWLTFLFYVFKTVFLFPTEIGIQNESSWTSVTGEAFEIVPQLEELDLSWNSNIGGKLSLLTKKLRKGCKIKLLKITDCNLTAKDGESLGMCIHM